MPLLSTGNPIGVPFIELQSVDSTNNYAMGLVKNSALTEGQYPTLHGIALFTHEQTAGKGQRNKNWISETGSSIALTVILKPDPLGISEQFYLSACVAISVRDFFANYAGDESKIKWPNDLYWRDRKAGGILIESMVRSLETSGNSRRSEKDRRAPVSNSWHWAIVGIGININQTKFPDDLANPVSLKQITGKNFSPVFLAQELCANLNQNFQLLISGQKELLLEKYQLSLYKKGEKVRLKKGNRVFDAIIKGVTHDGQLITYHTMEERFDFGEVEWLI